MNFAANYEIRSECSVREDGLVLRLQHPRGLYRVRLENIPRTSFDTPFLLSLHLYFEAPNLKAAQDVADELLGDCLNMLAFATSCRLRRHRIRQIVEATPNKAGTQSVLLWGESIKHEDPRPFLGPEITQTIERLLEFDRPPPIQRALRWYRIGVYEMYPDDQFMCFWFALELVAEHHKSTEKVPDRCPRCRTPLYCESCKNHPTHRPYPKQAIAALLKAVDPSCDESTVQRLDATRNGLMHGATLQEIEGNLPSPHEHVVDVLGRLLWKALIYQFPKEIFSRPATFGSPSTYVGYRVDGIAHIETVVPKLADGDLNLHFAGMTMTMEAGGPPQSARPTMFSLSSEQYQRLVRLSHVAGDHQEMCTRIANHYEKKGEEVNVGIPSTDMNIIRAALSRGETGDWQDLFREILSG